MFKQSLPMLFLVFCFVSYVCCKADLTIPDGYFSTPHGLRPSKCVVGVKSNSHKIIETPEGLHIKYFDNEHEDEFYPVNDDCIQNAYELGLLHAAKRKRASQSRSLAAQDGSLSRLRKSTNQNINDEHHPLDPFKNDLLRGGGWELYAGYYTTSDMGYFYADYRYPSSIPQANNNQILYYFIGAQDNYDNNLTIIQPVATYAPNGNGAAATPGYSGTPWNCCPSGLTQYGTPIPAQQGSIFNTYIATNDDSGNINIFMQLESTGQISQLVLQQDYRQYDWIDVTGEFYWDVGQCGELINSAFEFYNFTISALNGDIQVPDWYVLESDEIKQCNPSQSYEETQASITATQL